MRHYWIYLSALLIFFLHAVHASAAEFSEKAQELTAQAVIECTNSAVLTDGDETTHTKIADGGSVTITSDTGISSLYVIFDRIYGQWTLSDGITDTVCGEDGFLHEYIDAAELFGYPPTSLTMTFSGHDCSLSELHLFGDGEVPDWVQRWESPCEEADLMLVSTHIDDEQLFFAGILPYYAGERGLAVQVVYFTDPFTYHERPHEQLNGLWTVGVRNYPVSGEFKDAYSETAKDAYAHQRQYGYDREDMVLFQVEMIRRFRPHVVVGHDINGEYGHGQHIINCETLMEALDLAADPLYAPDSALAYGAWDTPKAYIHLWEENPIVMDWDEPLEAFGGKTAFQVSQEGFLCHKSQQWTWFRRWMLGRNNEITEASQIETYSPCLYGLYRTNVGLDSEVGDMFENIPQSYAEIKAEEIRLQEEMRLQEELRLQEEALAAAEKEAAMESGREDPESYDSGQAGLQGEDGSGGASGTPETEPVEADGSKVSDTGVIIVVAAVMALAALTILYLSLSGRRKNGQKKS